MHESPLGRLLAGDCLTVLGEALDAGGGGFDLVYVDPPFNLGVRHGAREGQGARARGASAYDDLWGGLDAFLAMLGPRLALMWRALAPRGSLWLHLDHRTVHDAKVLADGLFGRGSFRGEIVWVPGNGSRKRSGVPVTHQTLLVYSPSPEMRWNADAPALREPYADTSLRMHFTLRDEAGRAYRERVIAGKHYRYYADEGRQRGSVWSDCPAMTANTPLSRETTGYPTQKPESLLERIILATTEPGCRVLDPMCGSGTTLAVATRLGRAYLGIDQSAKALQVAASRLAAQG